MFGASAGKRIKNDSAASSDSKVGVGEAGEGKRHQTDLSAFSLTRLSGVKTPRTSSNHTGKTAEATLKEIISKWLNGEVEEHEGEIPTSVGASIRGIYIPPTSWQVCNEACHSVMRRCGF